MNLSDRQRSVLEKVLRKARESTAQMINTAENTLQNKEFKGDKEMVKKSQKNFELDLETIKELEETFL